MGNYTGIKSYGIRIKESNKKGLTVKAIADSLGKTRQHVHGLQNGSATCSVRRLGRIADIIGATPIELLPREYLIGTSLFDPIMLGKCLEAVFKVAINQKYNLSDSLVYSKISKIIVEVYQLASDRSEIPEEKIIALVLKTSIGY